MFDFKSMILSLLLSLPGLLLALTVHEFAHGYAALKMGDHTAEYSGRLSLNPLHHLDVIGTLCLLVFHFGWAKPVPINPNNFRNPKKGIIVVSLAGPFANFLLALVFGFVLGAIVTFMPGGELRTFLYTVVNYCVVLNVGLMVFNLIPVPPLDGSKVLLEFLPYRARYYAYRYERYIGLIFLALLYFGILSPVLGFLSSYVFRFIDLLVGLVF